VVKFQLARFSSRWVGPVLRSDGYRHACALVSVDDRWIKVLAIGPEETSYPPLIIFVSGSIVENVMG
jgi:hypothetical protein